jgi:uncharacterized protein DUF3551
MNNRDIDAVMLASVLNAIRDFKRYGLVWRHDLDPHQKNRAVSARQNIPSRRPIMRLMLPAVAAMAVTLMGSTASEAYYPANPALQGPWCAVESLGFGTVSEDCSMQTFEQCRMLTIAGNRGFCIPNPRWAGPLAQSAPPRAHKRRVKRR